MRAAGRYIFFLFIALSLICCDNKPSKTPDEIETHIKSILELPTFEHVYRDIVYIDKEKMFLIFKTMQTEVLFAIDVHIQAGLKLTEGFDLMITGPEAVSVSLPHAKILLVDADEASIEQFFIKERGGSISRLDYYDEINRKKEKLIDDAIERGILTHAEENARLIISNFLGNLGYTDIDFRIGGEL